MRAEWGAMIAAAALMTAPAGVAQAQVVPAGAVAETPAPAAFFTGRVTLRLLTKPTAPGQAGAALVTFAPGARSHWHTHPAGQTLYVTEGCGLAQEEGGPVVRICKGDTVYAKPGVKHWHGATANTAMTHLAVSEALGGKNVAWLEPVTDTQYHEPAR